MVEPLIIAGNYIGEILSATMYSVESCYARKEKLMKEHAVGAAGI